MNKTLAFFAVVVAVGGGLYWYSTIKPGAPVGRSAVTATSSVMRVEGNMVVANEQRPGNSVTISQVHLASAGFVVIHEDVHDAPGAILGSSSLLPAGDSSLIKVKLNRAVLDGTKLHAMLHDDTNGNGAFDATVDMPVQSKGDGPIEGWFDISANASENPAVSI